MSVKLRTLAALLLVLLAEAAMAAVGRYRVTLDLPPYDDPAEVARQFEAITRGRIESTSADGFVLVASDTALTTIGNDPKIARIEPLPPARGAGSPATWTGTYAYDGSGNIKSITRGTFTERYVYDAFGRLTSGTVAPGRTQSYTYDRFGNALTITTDSSVIRLGVNSATNRLDLAGPTYNVTASYDEAGRLTAVPALGYRFVYDGLDTLIELTVDERKVHLYTATDERVASVSIVNGSPSAWNWTIRDPSGKVLRTFAKTGSGPLASAEDYVYLGAQMLAAEVPGLERRRQFHLDHLGTPRLITGNGGAQIGSHTYFPFGGELTTSQEAERKKFTGHERDNAAVDYLHARYYAPSWGRFLSVDPGKDWDLRQPQSWNMYAYVWNNPINKVDPNGRCGVRPGEAPCAMSIEVSAPAPTLLEQFDFTMSMEWATPEGRGEIRPASSTSGVQFKLQVLPVGVGGIGRATFFGTTNGQVVPARTPAGQPINPHAAERMANPPAGRVTMTPAEADAVLAKNTIRKIDPAKATVTYHDPTAPGKPQVSVSVNDGSIVTVIKNRIRDLFK